MAQLQLPIFSRYIELSRRLVKKTICYQDVFNKSGNNELVEEHGDWFTYDKTPRALIFARDAPGVTDMDSMIRLMRYNNYTKDPLSKCDCVFKCNVPYVRVR